MDPFSDISGNSKGNLATLASDRCLRVFNASTKNFKNVAKTHRCKLRVPVSREEDKQESTNADKSLIMVSENHLINLLYFDSA